MSMDNIPIEVLFAVTTIFVLIAIKAGYRLGHSAHRRSEEEPEDPDYPKDPAFKARFGPRGVIHSWADGQGGQRIVDTGPLTKKRMETIDDEVTDEALRFIDEAHAADKPFFLWWNTTAMHFRTHPAEKHRGKSNGQGDYADVMFAHDENVGRMLDKLDELGAVHSGGVI